jgi:hypothetical protein
VSHDADLTRTGPSGTHSGAERRNRSPITGGIPRGLVVLLGLAAAAVAGAGIQAMAWFIGPIFLALTLVIVVSRPGRGWCGPDYPRGWRRSRW